MVASNTKSELCTDEWYCQWCDVWHVGETTCKGQDSRDNIMEGER